MHKCMFKCLLNSYSIYVVYILLWKGVQKNLFELIVRKDVKIPRDIIVCRSAEVWGNGKRIARNPEGGVMMLCFLSKPYIGDIILLTFASESFSLLVLPEVLRATWSFRYVEMFYSKNRTVWEQELPVAARTLRLFDFCISVHAKASNKNAIWEPQFSSVQWRGEDWSPEL